MNRPSSGLRSIAGNAAYNVTAKAFNIALRLGYVVLLARLLGRADYGLLVYALTWYVLFVPLTNLGQDLVLARALGGRAADAAEVVTATLALRLCAAVGVFMLAAGIGWAINPGDEGRGLVLAVSLATVPRALTVWSHTVFVAAERSRYMLRQDLVFRSLEVFVATAVLLSGGDVLMIALVHVGSWWLQALAGLSLVHRRLFALRLRPDPARWRAMLGEGLKLGFGRVIENWLLSGPVILFRHLSQDLDALGLVALCIQLVNVLRIVPNAIVAAAMPVLGRSPQHRGRTDGRLLLFIAGAAVMVGGGLAAVTAAVGAELVAITLGDSFAALPSLLPSVCWLAILPILGAAAQRVVGLRGHAGTVLASSAAGGLLMGLLGTTLIPGHGVTGILLAILTGSLLWVLGLSRCLPGIALRYAALAGGATLAGILALPGIATTAGATEARVATGWAIVTLLMLAGWGLDSWRARRSADHAR